ncbi:MAG: hypothetical protein QM638_23195 [Nocardioides sp.]|uniref:hypothetical protein n=1 Tax=Nocardioides sp. TaxID=35761 RepID=UPI0039E2D292
MTVIDRKGRARTARLREPEHPGRLQQAPAMKERLNAIKLRERDRPVAPICLKSAAADVSL